MASSLLALSDLINFQLERLKLDEFKYKDELQLLRQLVELDAIWQMQPLQLQRKQQIQQQTNQKFHKQPFQYQQQQHQQHIQQQQQQRSKGLQQHQQQQLQQHKQNLHQCQQYQQKVPTSISDVELGASAASFTTGQQFGGSLGAGISSITYGVSGSENTEIEIGAVGGAGVTSSQISLASSDLQKGFKAHVLEWFQQLRQQTSNFKKDEESRRLRESGNDSYRRERHALKACDFYTEALFRATLDNSITIAMAHANRSTVLHDVGLYEQSYDDCLCALDFGYPEEFYPLIKLRQASCALKMRNFNLCEEHLHELLHMKLSESFEKRTYEIWHECEILKAEKIEMGVQTGDDLQRNIDKVYEVAWLDNTNVITTNKGAFLRATANISTNTPVFQEDAIVFVSNDEARVCDNCAITQFVPFPCVFCTNRSAVYCSRKCRFEHASIHSVECFAHQIELFEEFSEEFSNPRLLQLALRMLITGLPQVLPHCRKKPTVNKMWSAFNGILKERTDIPYSAMLHLDAYADQEDAESLITFAIMAHIMAIYLNECTDFFEFLEHALPVTAKLTNNEWELLSAALLMRHICQLRHKSLIHCPSFVLPTDPHVIAPVNEFHVWAKIKHVREGQLHLLAGNMANVVLAVFPQKLSLCRQSCVDTIYCKFSGRTITAYTTCDLSAGTMISNCFASTNYRQSLYETRKLELNAKGIECKCEKCFRPNPDEDFHKFHRYRCDNQNCKQIFTPPYLKRTRNLKWWNSDYYTCPENNGSELLVCSVCDETQKLEWFWAFNAALVDCDSIEERCKLYAAIEQAENHLIEMHEMKVALARQLVQNCLLVHRETSKPLDEWEFNKLGSTMRSALNIVAAQYNAYSLEYVQHMSYFWDVMALSTYKCSDKELMQMLNALEYIPDEFKEVFINYYEDFIAPKFADETYSNVLDTQV
ncbi:SET and MYND domain-containing protein 4 [Teleopsis dalmanni]|uniref:SET and MYND domain-containing protein 4 n=1 Tax=Teleopsis dalmanni TaxID=139649 RepID=UPI0018CFA500|nr:SET and MYND domain-containing protein 4 [Teleopsis dalmanni]